MSVSRSVVPNGGAIREQRLKLGLNVERLSELADCSVKTIENLEKSERVYPTTLARVAKALGVEIDYILQAQCAVKDETKEETLHPRVKISIEMLLSFEDFDETRDLSAFMQALSNFIGNKNPLEVVSVRKGSVLVEITMSERDLYQLCLRWFDEVMNPDFVGDSPLLTIGNIPFKFDLRRSESSSLRFTSAFVDRGWLAKQKLQRRIPQ